MPFIDTEFESDSGEISTHRRPIDTMSRFAGNCTNQLLFDLVTKSKK